jgi:histidine triad (HIT) family protein
MECIFCKIVKGEIPSSKIYEDEEVLAFMDLFPVNRGHALIIPKEHYENLLEMDEEIVAKVSKIVRKVAEAVKKGVNAEGINISQSNGKVAGQEIMHTHFHVIPRFKEDELKMWPSRKYQDGEIEEYNDKIKKFI